MEDSDKNMGVWARLCPLFCEDIWGCLAVVGESHPPLLRFSKWHDSLCSRGGTSIAEEAPPIWISGSAFIVHDPSLKLCSELFLHFQAR